jgi:hypothetical protein
MSDNPVAKVVAPRKGATTGSLVAQGKYKCPSCDNTIEVFVRLSELPLCCNHATRVQMQKVGE